jgi:hypothetical protein
MASLSNVIHNYHIQKPREDEVRHSHSFIFRVC